MGQIRGRLCLASAALFAAIAPLLPQPAQAGFISGNMLYADCTTDKSDGAYWAKAARCSGYIVGAIDAWSLAAVFEGRPECLPESTTIGQLTDVVIKYLRENPGKRHYSGSNLVALAVNDAFGCAILPPARDAT